MSTLMLVRHGQASFFEDDYDQLSVTGEAQARCLGLFWASQGVIFDESYTGPRLRHRRTADLVGQAYNAAGLPWPRPVLIDELDEHAVDLLLRGSLAELSRSNPLLGPLAESYARAEAHLDRHRTFQKLFEAVMRLWCQGACEMPDVEPWPSFRDRVLAGIARMTQGRRRGRRIAAFTSVGPISAALLHVLGCPDTTALELGWRLRNASLTEFLFSGDRMTLDSFNGLPHLDDRMLWTYR
jgi:broad specificity phosphatase PhoE